MSSRENKLDAMLLLVGPNNDRPEGIPVKCVDCCEVDRLPQVVDLLSDGRSLLGITEIPMCHCHLLCRFTVQDSKDGLFEDLAAEEVHSIP